MKKISLKVSLTTISLLLYMSLSYGNNQRVDNDGSVVKVVTKGDIIAVGSEHYDIKKSKKGVFSARIELNSSKSINNIIHHEITSPSKLSFLSFRFKTLNFDLMAVIRFDSMAEYGNKTFKSKNKGLLLVTRSKNKIQISVLEFEDDIVRCLDFDNELLIVTSTKSLEIPDVTIYSLVRLDKSVGHEIQTIQLCHSFNKQTLFFDIVRSADLVFVDVANANVGQIKHQITGKFNGLIKVNLENRQTFLHPITGRRTFSKLLIASNQLHQVSIIYHQGINTLHKYTYDNEELLLLDSAILFDYSNYIDIVNLAKDNNEIIVCGNFYNCNNLNMVLPSRNGYGIYKIISSQNLKNKIETIPFHNNTGSFIVKSIELGKNYIVVGGAEKNGNQTIPRHAFFDRSVYKTSTLDEDKQINEFNIYPNPLELATKDFSINLPDNINKEGTLQVLTISGQLVSSTLVRDSKFMFNHKSLTKGVYLARFITKNRTYTSKLILK